MSTTPIDGTPFEYYPRASETLAELQKRVADMRVVGKLNPQVLARIQKFFRIKGIYHSNAIEGNSLTIGETRMVVEMGLTLSGKTLRDQAEAKNLSHALDFMEELATRRDTPITLTDVRQIHSLILKDIDDENAGQYRTTEVRISGSLYKPPAPEAVAIQMHGFGAWLQTVSSVSKRNEDPILIASAAHSWLAQIHPFVDGNGRTSRILMNLLLMRHGYPICIITHDDRMRYYDALEQSQAADLTPLIELVLENVHDSLEEWEKAAAEQRVESEWLDSIATRFAAPARAKAENEYELWSNAMDLLRTYFKQTAGQFNERAVGGARITVKDYGMLGFEQYLSLRDGEGTKRTWFFRIDFLSGIRSVRYLFFFGYASAQMRPFSSVVLIVAKETEPYSYERLDIISALAKLPDLIQIGFDMRQEQFVALTRTGIKLARIEEHGRTFFEQVVERDFDQ